MQAVRRGNVFRKAACGIKLIRRRVDYCLNQSIITKQRHSGYRNVVVLRNPF